MKKIKVIIKRPDEEAGHMSWISDTLKNLQKTVGGYIETVTVSDNIVIICNEEGRLLDLPYNTAVRPNGHFLSSFYGTIIVAGTDGDEFASLPDGFTMRMWKEWIG